MHWRVKVLATPYKVLRPLQQGNWTVMFTDASLTGFGIVVFSATAPPFVVAGPFQKADRIDKLETWTVALGVRCLPETKNESLLIFIDNTTTLASIRRSRSRNYALNCMVDTIYDEVARRGYSELRVEYVPSDVNIADVWSRFYQ